jgi:hypothetical protein
MTSVRAFANLFCSTCNEVTLHRSNVCTADGCNTRSLASGNPPVPANRGFNTLRGHNYSASKQAQGDARRRARHARHQVLSRGPK